MLSPYFVKRFLYISFKLLHTKRNNEKEQAYGGRKREEINETGSIELTHNNRKHNIQLLTIIGEIEGHEAVSGNTKATKYEHLLPKLAEVEDNEEIEGLLILLNTLGGDVEAGLAIAEMIASLGKPTVSLVLGGSHSIGGPLAVSADYSFIVPSGTMIIHPVRSNGMFIGVIQSYRNMERTQDRIIRFLAGHSHMTQERIEELMLDSTQLVKDVGTLLEGEEAVKEGLIDAVGGMSDALTKLHEMIEEKMNKNR
ncbi:MAG: ClpP family protease [[Clostridium] nexile]